MKNGCGGCRGRIPFGYFGVVAKRKREDAAAEFIEREAGALNQPTKAIMSILH